MPPLYTGDEYAFRLFLDQEPAPIRLAARPTTHLTVEIVDARGKRVADARVLTKNADGFWSGVLIAKDGEFETNVAEGDKFRLAAFSQSWEYGKLDFDGEGDEERTERVVMAPAYEHPAVHRFRARVVDQASGRGISGATISILFESPHLGIQSISSSALKMPGIVTDSDGWLRIDAVPFREAILYVRKNGYLGANAGFPMRERDGTLVGEAVLSQSRNRTVMGRSEWRMPVEVWYGSRHWNADWDEKREAFRLHGFGSSAKTVDLHHRPKTEIAKTRVIRDVPIGSDSVVLRPYPMGDVLVRCLGHDGTPIPRACVAFEGSGLEAYAWKENARGRLLFKNVPVGELRLWAWMPGFVDVGPLACTVREGERTEVIARFGRSLPLVAVYLGDAHGKPLGGFRVHVLKPNREALHSVSERFRYAVSRYDSTLPPDAHLYTLSDGWCFLSVLPGVVVVALQSDNSMPFGYRRVTVPKSGRVDVKMRLDD